MIFFKVMCVLFIFVVQLSKCHSKNIEEVNENFESFFAVKPFKRYAQGILYNQKESNECLDDIKLAIHSLLDETWAMEMLDSGGRVPYGLLKGNFNSLGQYGECMDVTHKRNDSDRIIRGKYCVIKIPIPEGIAGASGQQKANTLAHIIDKSDISMRALNMHELYGLVYNLGICIPDSCAGSSVEEVLQGLWEFINIAPGNITVPERFCTTGVSPPWSAGEIAALTVICFIFFIVMLSTLYDLWILFIVNEESVKPKPILASFSAYTNSKKLITLSKDQGPLSCIHGIRMLSLFWIILGHGYGNFITLPVENIFDAVDWIRTYEGMLIVASGVGVDTFFVISGVLLSYVFFRQKSSGSFWKNLPIFYLHRILRLTPVLGMVILFTATLAPRMMTSPFISYFMEELIEPCRQNWWTNLLYVQNYVYPSPMCVTQTWYLAVDMQLYILSPLLLFPLLKKPKIGMALSVLVTIAAQVTLFVIVYFNEWYGGTITPQDPNGGTHETRLYLPTHTRATPWLLGFVAGFILKDTVKKDITAKRSPKAIIIIRCMAVIGWLCCFGIMAGVLLGMYPLAQPAHTFSHWQDTTYLAFHRTAWTVAVLWVMFACAHGYGGPINWILSLRIWEFLGRLSYSMFLNHMLIQIFFLSQMKNINLFTHAIVIYQFFGDLVASVIVAYLMYLAFESPVTVLERIFLKK